MQKIIWVMGLVLGLGQQAHAADGAVIFNKCKACHTAEQGGPNRVGPNLFGIVGRPAASNATFKYSPAFLALKGKKTWSEQELDAYLTSPKTAVPGTRMIFSGLPTPAERQALIQWLKNAR